MLFSGKVLLIVLLISQAQLGIGAKLLEYGEECDIIDGSTPCNQKSKLHCLNNKCVCNAYTFLQTGSTKPCKSYIGSSCTSKEDCAVNAVCKTRTEGSFLGKGTIRLPASLQKEWNQIIAIHNSDTDGLKTCSCPTGFMPDKLQQDCVKVLQFEEECSPKLKKSGLDCHSGAGLTCNSENICACSGTNFYDKEINKCVVPLGGKCNSLTTCEKGAICPSVMNQLKLYFKSYSIRYGTSSLNYNQIFQKREFGDRCVCTFGHSANKEGKCVGSYGAECSEAGHCNADEFLGCIDGFCQCEKGTSEVFIEKRNGTTNSCQLSVGSTCNVKKGPTCAGNSICKNGQCKCAEGFSLASHGNCLMNHGSTCKVPSSNGCNSFQGLACIGDECSCFDSSLKWNSKEKKCAAKEGSRCGKFGRFLASPLDGSSSGNGEAEFYVAGCEHGLICSKDEATGLSYCHKEER